MCAMGGLGGAGALLRPCTFLEELCEMGHLNDSLLTGYVLRLRSAQPLTRTQLMHALIHLRRQVPCLRLCFGENGGTTWLQESTEETIDLEMVEHDTVDEVLTAVSRYRYRSRTGPLWCVKMLIGYPANRPPMLVGETVSRPDTGIGTSSPEGENQDLPPRPDTGFGAHPSERFQCRPLMPGEVIEVPLHDPNRCVILPLLAPQPDPGQVQYDPMMGAAGLDAEGAIGGYLPPFAPDYAAGPSGYNEPGAGPSGYGGQHDHGEEEFYGSGGSVGGSSGVSPTGDQNTPDLLPSESMDPFWPGRPMAERASVSKPYSRPSCSNPSSASSASIFSRSTQVAPSAGAGAVKQKGGELAYRLEEFDTEEGRGAAVAATAAAAVRSKEIGSSRSSFIDTSSSASPAFLDTGSSSLSSSPRRRPSSPSLEMQRIIGGNSACVSNLVFGIHQGIADGITAMRICGRLIKLLNDTIGELDIDDSVPLEENTAAELSEILNASMIYLSDLTEQEEMKAEMEERSNWVSNLSGVFGEASAARPNSSGRRPRHLNHHEVFSLDAVATARLLERCQSEDVGLLAAFSAVANIALMDILTARDVIKDTYNFYSSHNIDLRRYDAGIHSQYLMGCLFSPVHLCTPTPRHAPDNFWDFARIFESDFKQTEERDEVLRELAMMELNRPELIDYEDLFSGPPPQMKDFFTCYLEDVTPLVTEGGPHMTVEYVEATTSFHKLGYACCHVLHIFSNSLCITLNYSSMYLTVDLGREYMSNIYRRLNEML